MGATGRRDEDGNPVGNHVGSDGSSWPVRERPARRPGDPALTPAGEAAVAIWQAAVDAVRPERLLSDYVSRQGDELCLGPPDAPSLRLPVGEVGRLVVVGCGKAGVAMAAALESALDAATGRAWVDERVSGLVNVPASTIVPDLPTRRIRLHAARNTAANVPTAEGVAGTEEMLRLLGGCGPADVAVCLISGGGSALLPAPVEGLTLAAKQDVTKRLAACGATIREINCVRKHLSRAKGGRMAEAFRGRAMAGLVLSDVVGDPLDVISSGPTAPDPTTFADAVAVMERYGLRATVAAEVMRVLDEGAAGRRPDTPKVLPAGVRNVIIGSARIALAAAGAEARRRGMSVVDLGAFVEGETAAVAGVAADIARSILTDDAPVPAPACVLIGGETTVTLGPSPGKGGRNQEFALAAAMRLGLGRAGAPDADPQAADIDRRVAILSGGTDGEDGPTDAAGAVADASVMRRAVEAGVSAADHLARHDAYPFFDAAGGLLRPGPTNTNVMDVRVIVVGV